MLVDATPGVTENTVAATPVEQGNQVLPPFWC
jgi:hypothetical protein